MTSRMRRQIQANNELATNSTLPMYDLTKAKTRLNQAFTDDNKNMRIRNLMNTHKTRMHVIRDVLKTLIQYK